MNSGRKNRNSGIANAKPKYPVYFKDPVGITIL